VRFVTQDLTGMHLLEAVFCVQMIFFRLKWVMRAF